MLWLGKLRLHWYYYLNSWALHAWTNYPKLLQTYLQVETEGVPLTKGAEYCRSWARCCWKVYPISSWQLPISIRESRCCPFATNMVNAYISNILFWPCYVAIVFVYVMTCIACVLVRIQFAQAGTCGDAAFSYWQLCWAASLMQNMCIGASGQHIVATCPNWYCIWVYMYVCIL